MQKKWNDWVDRRRVRTVVRHFRKQQAVLREGLQVYADVLDCYETNLAQEDFRLVRLRLSIPLKDRVAMVTWSATFTELPLKTLRGLRLRIRFVPGDLSHVVIVL